MSGLAGLVLTDGEDVSPEMLQRLSAANPNPVFDGTVLWHRGPVGFARFALHVTPESVGEVQPFLDPGSRMALLFDGRIDNRDELLDRLGQVAPSRGAPDGEIVLAAFARFGDEAIHLLVGDYAFALWCPERRRLYCARSPVGFRPFLWTFDGRRFGFATEPRTLVKGLNLDSPLNEGAIAEYLSGKFVTLTDTFWRDVHRLPPGSALVLEKGQVRTWRWNEGPFEDLSHLSDDEHVERFIELFDQALIAVHRSNGPVAAHLSGGLDSSSVVCRSVELWRAGRIGSQVQPLSARFPGQTCDEGQWIEAVERKAGIATTSLSPTRFTAEFAAEWCGHSLHLPLRPNTLSVLTPAHDMMVSRGQRVLLTGEGGDDWFSGSVAHWPDLLRKGRVASVLREGLDQGSGASVENLLAILRQGLLPALVPPELRRQLLSRIGFGPALPDYVSPDWARRVNLRDRFSAHGPPRLGGLAQRKRYEIFAAGRRFTTYDVGLSFAASRGIQTRHPFHDRRLTAFAMGARGAMVRRHGLKKYVLREAMRGTLPEEVRTRRTKANFAAAIVNAGDERLRQKSLEDLLPVKLGWVDKTRLRAIHDDYMRWVGAGALPPFPAFTYAPVWNTLAMDLWLENAFKL